MNGANQASRRGGGNFGRLWKFAAAVVGIAAGIAAVAHLNTWPQRLCLRLQAEIEAAESVNITPLVDRLTACGAPALPALTTLLGSTRPEVADAAREALHGLMHRLESGDEPDAVSAETLAAELARAAAQLSPPERGRHVAATLELLEAVGRRNLARDDEASDRRRILSICEELLRSNPDKVAKVSVLESIALAAGAPNVDAQELVSPNAPSTSDVGPSPEPRTLPAPNAAAPRTNDASSTSADRASSPSSIGPEFPAGGGTANIGAVVQSTAGQAVRRAVFSSDVPPPQAAALASETDRGVSRPSPVAATPPSQATAWELFDDAASDDAERSALARHELVRRRFSPAEIELGRRFATAKESERRLLVEALPSQSGLDLRPWLLHFCADDDPRVRLAALTIMATTGDPQLLDRVKQAAFTDPDEEIRRTAGRLLSGR